MNTQKLSQRLGRIPAYLILLGAAVVSLFPIVLIIINSFKERKAIFRAPWMPPTTETFSLVGYEKVIAHSNFGLYFTNSLTVALGAMFLILFFGAMAAWALSESDFRGNRFMGLYLALGIMIPIRLGTVSILRLVVSLGLINTLLALILVYTAMGLPLTIFILQQFMRQVPTEMKDAARVDLFLRHANVSVHPIVDDDHDDGEPILFGGRQLFQGCHDASIAGERHDSALRIRDLSRDRRWELEPLNAPRCRKFAGERLELIIANKLFCKTVFAVAKNGVRGQNF